MGRPPARPAREDGSWRAEGGRERRPGSDLEAYLDIWVVWGRGKDEDGGRGGREAARGREAGWLATGGGRSGNMFPIISQS